MTQSDLIVIGAGPAGMAAASEAASHGLTVTLLDEQPRAGGQIYRDVDHVPQSRAALLGRDYTHGRTLTAKLRAAGVVHLAGAVVWSIEDGFTIAYTQEGRAAQITGARLCIATGALERPMPLPGWTLPGVMTAGAGQILLKQSGLLARRAVLVGCGPLLYLIAAQMVRAGVPPLALVETQTRQDIWHARRHLGGALRGWRYLAKGVGLLSELRRAGVRRYTGARDIRIDGDDRAEAVCFSVKGQDRRIACDAVMLHHGVVPNTQAARSIDVPHLWDPLQQCFAPDCDTWGKTPVAGVHVIGDGAGIGGAMVAELSGRLAALDIAVGLKRLSQADRDTMAAPLMRARARERAIRPFLDRAYPPYAPALAPEDGTLICRCEEVTAGDIRRAARMGCLGPNQAKSFARSGMGPCQGRYCGLSVSAVLAKATGQTLDETGYFRVRPPLKPVTLGELAGLQTRAPERAEEETP